MVAAMDDEVKIKVNTLDNPETLHVNAGSDVVEEDP